MNDHFEKVQRLSPRFRFQYFTGRCEEDGVFWVENEEAGIHNLSYRLPGSNIGNGAIFI